jgi:hypothetical protein
VNSEQLFLVPIHRYGFRAGEPAAILGTQKITPHGLPTRLCYEVEFPDGTKDFVPIKDGGNFRIISASDILSGKIPEVAR